MFENREELRRRRRRRIKLLFWTGLAVGTAVALFEFSASPLQALFLSDYAQNLTFKVEAGASKDIRFPRRGPYDLRLGYARLPDFIPRLQQRGFEVARQARISHSMDQLAGYGLFLPYREKSVAGLHLLDSENKTLFNAPYPRHAYTRFTDIPRSVAYTLLFIENRELLDPNHPRRNPAVEWDRLAQAVLEKGMQIVDPSRNVPGGSTLATQIEKYRHSPDGLTLTAGDKLTQMASASVRAYLEGADTRVTRRRIVQDYLNTVPLAAAPGYGEVHGIGDGLEAWFGLDFAAINQLLWNPQATPETARAYKHVLALLISQRKPSHYLVNGREALNNLSNVHLRLLAEANIISPALRDLALREPIVFANGKAKAKPDDASFVDNKAVNAARVELARMLGVDRLYDLDKLDLTVDTSLHGPTQRAVTEFLKKLRDPAAVAAHGLYGQYLFAPGNDLSKVVYSFTLYELTQAGGQLRVQVDNLNQPFDLNQGAKLDMGSSAKLRTLITYLQIVADLHAQYAWMQPERLADEKVAEQDALSQWALDYLKQTENRSLTAMLEAAMYRQYSANPDEAFFTGGGLHRFANFHREDNAKAMDLWEATRNSVNLPFIRLMRDIVRHLIYRMPNTAAQVLSDPKNPERKDYLAKFADEEGKLYLGRFHKKYKGLNGDEITAALLNHLAANPRRLAAVYRYIHPTHDLATFSAFMKGRLTNPTAYSEAALAKLYRDYGPERFSLGDRGYIVQIHPLELWLAGYLINRPKADWQELVANSREQRIAGYDWLFQAAGKDAQDSRIHSLMEIEAFQEIHRRWRGMGYPFSGLVPSYATAIGSSADRPAALADLVGVIINDGVRLPTASINRLEFAAGTPYQTEFARTAPQGERVIPVAVAQMVRRALINVVQEGTARRLSKAFALPEGGQLAIGGKTGTGDNRYEVFAPDGSVLESKVVNRVATFAFFLGDRFYGVMTAYVPGEAAGEFHFTSGLPAQLLKLMEPALRPLVLAAGPQAETAKLPKRIVPPKPMPPAADAATPAPGRGEMPPATAKPVGETSKPTKPATSTQPKREAEPPKPPEPPKRPKSPWDEENFFL
ncbi:MAG: transglycosylase domain-containing protein [Betaproteobacteria bacterium]|nr:transglycosylase domain-containing protein [Betaproteobacteria bacterium]